MCAWCYVRCQLIKLSYQSVCSYNLWWYEWTHATVGLSRVFVIFPLSCCKPCAKSHAVTDFLFGGGEGVNHSWVHMVERYAEVKHVSLLLWLCGGKCRWRARWKRSPRLRRHLPCLGFMSSCFQRYVNIFISCYIFLFIWTVNVSDFSRAFCTRRRNGHCSAAFWHSLVSPAKSKQ